MLNKSHLSYCIPRTFKVSYEAQLRNYNMNIEFIYRIILTLLDEEGMTLLVTEKEDRHRKVTDTITYFVYWNVLTKNNYEVVLKSHNIEYGEVQILIKMLLPYGFCSRIT